MCVNSKFVKNPKYKPNKKNGGKVPIASDPRALYVPIGCGVCMECRAKKKSEWQIRLQHELKTGGKCYFITLTFDEGKLNEHKLLAVKKADKDEKDIRNTICTIAVRRWLERVRADRKESLKHWLITELGDSHSKRIHMHGFVWCENEKWIKNYWNNGYVFIGHYMSPKAVTYTTKYVLKINKNEPDYKCKILSSSGIGKSKLDNIIKSNYTFKGKETLDKFKTESGKEVSIPIYYRNKLFTEEQREKLWMHKLDERIMWVGGRRIRRKDYKTNEDWQNAIMKNREEAIRENNQMGYKSVWDKAEYKKMLNKINNKMFDKTNYQQKEDKKQIILKSKRKGTKHKYIITPSIRDVEHRASADVADRANSKTEMERSEKIPWKRYEEQKGVNSPVARQTQNNTGTTDENSIYKGNEIDEIEEIGWNWRKITADTKKRCDEFLNEKLE